MISLLGAYPLLIDGYLIPLLLEGIVNISLFSSWVDNGYDIVGMTVGFGN